MKPDDDLSQAEDWQIEALVAFDEALAAGRASEVPCAPESPLHAVHECQRLLERVWPRMTSRPPEPPRRFGRFLLHNELGRGGFGVVYLATDTVLQRKVALKLPRPEIAFTPDFRRRFLREGEAASRLDHPHIVPIFEIGEEGAVCYIASAYCEGSTLAHWLRQRSTPVPARLAAELLAKLALAVGHAHERGILHRDLKPKNILLHGPWTEAPPEPDAAGFVPRICDFGLAKILDQDAGDTCSGVAIGSPAYMAPEQAAGRLREIGPGTDVYALGVILYELLTGRTPFQGETVLETLHHVSEGEPPPPRSLRPGVPRDLDTICMKCLERRPDRRYRDGSDLADDLGRFLEARPIRAQPASGWTHLEKWIRRRPAHAALAGLLVLTLIASMVGLAWSGAREKRYNTNLRQALEKTRESEQKAQRLYSAGRIRLAQLSYDMGKVEIAADILDDVRSEPGRPNPRTFAWSYLDRLRCRQLPHILKLPGGVTVAALSADGRVAALGDDKGGIRIWDMAVGTVRLLESAHLGGVRHLAFSPDGRTLAAGGARTTELWDLGTDERWASGAPQMGRSDLLRFDAAGTTLTTVRAEGDPDGATVRVWTLEPRNRRATLQASYARDRIQNSLNSGGSSTEKEGVPLGGRRHSSARGAALTPDGLTLAHLDADDTIRLFDTRDALMIAIGRRDGDTVTFVPLTVENTVLPPAEVHRIGERVQRLSGHPHVRCLGEDRAVHAAAFSPDGASLAFFASKADQFFGEIAVIDVASGERRATYTLGDHTSKQGIELHFTPDGRAILITGDFPKALLWQWAPPPDPPSPSGHEDEVWGLAYSPDGRILASSSDDHSIKLWNTTTGKLEQTLIGHTSLVADVAFSSDGRRLASASFDRTVALWDVARGKRTAVLEGHTGYVRTVAFSPDGKLVASAGNDGTVRLWDAVARCARNGPRAGRSSLIVYSVAFSPDGRLLVSGGDDRTIRLWDLNAGCRLREIRSENRIQSLAFSPDGSTLATSTATGIITLWDPTNGLSRPPLLGHSLEVLGLAFSPDGRTLASAGRDGTVRLWDPATGQELLTLQGHKHRVHAVAFSPDGATLASGSFDGVIKLWRTASEPD